MKSSSILLFVTGTIVTGSLNSILTKYQDLQCVGNCDVEGGQIYFDQPLLQTLQMFLGEMLCWIPVLILIKRGSKSAPVLTNDEESGLIPSADSSVNKKECNGFNSLLLALPSICDLLGTTLMNIGLLYTPVSIYQMTRGSIILIVGFFSVMFLEKRITKLEWMSLFVVFFGVFLVGLSGYLNDQSSNPIGKISLDVIIGMSLVFTGIIISASQFVIEEHILETLSIEPDRLVGYEGLYGTILTFTIMIIGHLIYGKGEFNMVEGFSQMFSNKKVLLSSFAIMVSICSFNYCGLTLTNMLNATTRSTVDTSRTLLVWIMSLIIGWESFHMLQLFAFCLLVFGTFSFNGVLSPETWKIVPKWLKELETAEHT